MKKIFLLCFLIILVFSFASGCKKDESLIVRYDINEDELDIFYDDISSQEVMQAFGLPHYSVGNFKQKVYHYYTNDGYIEVYFRNGRYAGNTVAGDNAGLELLNDMKASDKNIGKTDKTKYLSEVRHNITQEELKFIKAEITSKDIQSVLGAPHGIELYSLYKNNHEENLSNAFLYVLKDREVLKLIYNNKGKIFIAWIENEDSIHIKSLLDTDGIEVQKE